ncbi:MAG TPA: dynamin family protein [Candidatus Baltobacteraceae bacterium]|nr:dynamin family protein [Candidatus Baltobacteraceae bacterium]
MLAVVGEFSSGKSFLLNALLGKFGLLATDINPSTATITELEYGPETTAHAHYEDGRTARVPIERLSKFVANDEDAPLRVVVQTDSAFLQRGFTLADTPGLASINPAHRRATLQFLPGADAVLYLIDTQQPFSEGDASFLGIIRQHLDTIFIVQTKIDLWEQPGESGKPAWQSAAERIQQLAAVHAPGAYVYALSAKVYADGVQQHDPAAIERSRFEAFLSALDASLVRNTGRARIRRAREVALEAAQDELERIERDRSMLALGTAELQTRRAAVQPQLDHLQQFTSGERDRARSVSDRLVQALCERGNVLAEDAQQALAHAFDTADIARLRDRARLHILVDRTLGQTAGIFAQEVAAAVHAEYRRAAADAAGELPLRFDFAQAAAQAFGSNGASNMWNEEPARALAAAIVLEALGGPAINLVQSIAAKFAGAQTGTYMKRELTADLRAQIWPEFENGMRAFADDIANRIARIRETYDTALSEALARATDALSGSIDRALAVHQTHDRQSDAGAALRDRAQTVTDLRAAIDTAASAFLERGEEIAAADAGPETVRRAHIATEFDRGAYQKGLRPQRWRVAVIGALRRGKSSLINAFAGHRVLADEVAGAIAYPVHVRYGEQEEAFALQADGEWREVEIESALEEATRNPVLILTPWSLPRELVLVHAPAFDAGDSTLEDVCMVAAREASEVLCLFSRQLSDRELSLYERIAALGKPMLFAHTLADNETSPERRGVVTLAQEYLRERSIPVQRIFTVSTLEHAQARREHRAPAGWNEVDALISTVSAHAEEHMARLSRLERAASVPAAPPVSKGESKPKPLGLLGRLLKR